MNPTSPEDALAPTTSKWTRSPQPARPPNGSRLHTNSPRPEKPSSGRTSQQVLDAIGVGIGPFNLSLAALLAPIANFNTRFFDQRQEFQWHQGLLLPGTTIQNNFLKDLVSLADPTSRYSYLSYLFSQRRLYRFINAGLPKIHRKEYNRYLRWVCNALPNLQFGSPVESIDFDSRNLVVDLTNGSSSSERPASRRFATRNIILGTGPSPRIPAFAEPLLGPTVVHSNRFLLENIKTAGKRIAVIGSGQSGAELISYLLGRDAGCRKVHWITRLNFLPIDDSPFTEEIFTPAYSDFFFGLEPEVQERLVREQRLASDGIAIELTKKIYRQLYELEFVEEAGRSWQLHPETELLDIERDSEGLVLKLHNRFAQAEETLPVDVVILATGYEQRVPPCLDALRHRINLDGLKYSIRKDFSIEWDGPASQKIYVQNAARHCRGIPDPNLSLMAWRSATIVNSLIGEKIYDVDNASTVFEWPEASEDQALDAT